VPSRRAASSTRCASCGSRKHLCEPWSSSEDFPAPAGPFVIVQGQPCWGKGAEPNTLMILKACVLTVLPP
jgi:hypothetical protein